MRVTLDGEANEVVLFAQDCSFTLFWGLEVMSSAPVRTPSRSYIYGTAPDLKFINMFLHDMADGIDLWTTATNAELYGSLVYHNGWDETNGGHGHGIYTQNKTGVKRIQDNIFFSQYGYNVKVWSTNQFVDNFVLEGNIVLTCCLGNPATPQGRLQCHAHALRPAPDPARVWRRAHRAACRRASGGDRNGRDGHHQRRRLGALRLG